MTTVTIDILNPKANKLLKDLEDLKLISIRDSSKNSFLDTIQKLRAKAAKQPPSPEVITKEVEAIRTKRNGQERK
jgi:hypothetical protein